jgi:glyoxylase-like metal-dependent hydrolase (beta-lactamase superfamily II)
MPQPRVSSTRTQIDLGEIAPGLTGLRVVMVNVYAIAAEDGTWTLIDAGLPLSAGRIRRWAERRFSGPPKSIVLTHGHFDHVGALKELAELWNVPVYAHRLEMPYLTGQSSYPPPDPTVGRGARSRMSRLFPRGPVNLGERIRRLPEDSSVPGLPRWRWIHTPGHTPGHVSLFREDDRTLVAGDAFVTTQQESLFSVLTQRVQVSGPPAYYTSDWQAAGRSVGLLALLEPAVMATGHGLPLMGSEALRDLRALARNFELWAVPEKGRYVRRPAVADERGVISVPPALGSPVTNLLMAGVAVAGLWWAISARRR